MSTTTSTTPVAKRTAWDVILGLLLVAAQKNTIRFVPALTVENEEIDEAVAILRKVLQSFAV